MFYHNTLINNELSIIKAIKTITLTFCFLSVLPFVQAQKIYNPEADAKSDIKQAIKQAQQQNKHILLQIGGNWCPWCIKMHHFFEDNETVKASIQANYIFLEVNYSKANYNLDIMKSLGYPQRFGFPVLVVLDAQGMRLHTQNSAYLEKDNSYDEKKVLGFLKDWSPKALKDENYTK